MKFSRHSIGLMLLGAGGLLLSGPALGRLFAASTVLGTGVSTPLGAGQDSLNRRELTVVAKDFHYSPQRIEVTQDDLVKITLRSEDIAHSFTIDEYRIVKRVTAGGTTTFEFRADRPGTFPFYCNLTGESGHQAERGELVVRGR